MVNRAAFAILLAFAPTATAETWLKIDPNDPFSKEGIFHHFDVEGAVILTRGRRHEYVRAQ